MSAPRWASHHVRSLVFLVIALIAAGVFAMLSLPVSLFPHVNFPRIRVNIDAGDRPAERMEFQVTRPVELALRGIPGVQQVQSTTSRGSAEVAITFEWGQDMTAAYLQAQAEMNRVLVSLPAETTFQIRRMDPTVFPVIAYSLTSEKRPLTDLRNFAQYSLVPVLSKVSGVARVGVDGAGHAEIHVVLSPAKLAAHDLTLSDVTSALSRANVLSAVGHVREFHKLYLVIADAALLTLDDIRRIPLRATAGGVTTIGDIADVQASTVPEFIHATSNGRDCILVNVYQQPAGNTVQIAAGIRNALNSMKSAIPPDVAIVKWYDQSDLITQSASGVRDAVLIGVGLAALVLLLFLRDWRMTVIAAVAVPVVLAITALILYVLGQSLNIMTLGGMAAAVGLIIDDAIVMSEHIARRLHVKAPSGNPSPTGERVIAATSEFTRPLMGSSLSTIIIHIPPAFLVGVFGAFFGALSLAMASSLIISFFVAWLVIPVLASRLLKTSHVDTESRFALFADRVYAGMMRQVIRVPWLAIVLAVPVLLWGYLAYSRVPSGVIPSVDEGGFVIDYVGPPGASIADMDRLLYKVEAILQKTPEVQSYSRRTGFSLGGDISETNNGDFFVRLKPLPRRSLDAVMDDVSQQVAQQAPGLEIEPAKLMEDLLGDLTGRPEPVVVNLFGNDEQRLISLAPKVANALGTVPGLSSIVNGVTPAGDALELKIDQTKAALEGFDAQTLEQSLSDAIGGTVATDVQENELTLGVRVWTPANVRDTSTGLMQLPLRAPDGHLVPLARVAHLDVAAGQPEINRLDLERVVAITARSSRDLGSTIRDVKAVLDRPGVIPAGVRYTLGGQYKEQQAAFRGTSMVIIAAIVLVFVLLLVLYERVRVAIAILLTTALAIASVLIALRITGTELNISSMMGMVMIVGNVTEVAIFYFSEYADLQPSGDRNERLIAAGTHRLRAIVMTTLAAILALLPLALNWGNGGEMLKPLAIAIIAGLAVQLPLVLIGLPCWLVLFGLDRSERPESPH
ncbi:MAG: efflux RND transporter permease subunit [Phycisphaerae bacterium]